ncbi:uncharacterized protein ALTATR162_LOCUS1139 [Alternaria atra]|uniref:Uncharacterized protein n=1 Tax=Alternaria atra TaxID=119953 RepID=A0A8J2HTG4_9PLEO|nr:uncharacterized protein ALTATR162_LOCUS1139 [Alternaria atra]CAG5142373.1 unnamed protein product [Alternaria atra]
MVATPMATYYPLLDITGRDVVDMAAPIVVEEASKPASTDAKTIMVAKDEAWEAEYLKAMEEMEYTNKERTSGKTKRCSSGNAKTVKRCFGYCSGL